MSTRTALLSRDKRPILLVSFAAFFLLGALQALYGPSFPLLRDRFGVGLDQVSLVVSAQFLGSFAAIIGSAALLRLFGYRRVLLAGAGCLAVGMFGVVLAPSWWLLLAAAGLGGVGFGLLNVSGNLMVAVAFRPNAAPALNLINAVFGIGAVVGPLLVAVSEPRFGPPFLIVGAAGLLLAVAVFNLKAPEVTVPQADALPLAWSSVAGFVMLYVFYVSAEVGVTSWETEYLTPQFGAVAAAGFTSLYWGAITVGRVLATPLSARIRPQHMVLGAAALSLVFMVLAHVVELAPLAYALVGLSLAPIFPTGLAWLTEVFPQRAEQVTPLVVAAANLGPTVSAPLIGLAVGFGGVSLIPTALSALTLLLLVTVVWLWARTRT